MKLFGFDFGKRDASVTIRVPRTKNMKRSFSAAKSDDLLASFSGSLLPINEELRRDLRTLRARSRQLCMDNDYARKFLHMIKSNVIGVNGITLQARFTNPDPKTGAPKPCKNDCDIMEKAWRDWSRPQHCSVTGQHSWLDIQKMCVASVARDGEVLVRMIPKRSKKYGFILRVYPADYLDEQHNQELQGGGCITMGVETDRDGMVVAYHLRKAAPRSHANVYRRTDYERVPAANIVHLYLSDYPEQARGVPWMHTAIRRLNMLGGYEEAELVAARVGASKMGFYKTPDGNGAAMADDLAPEGQEYDDHDLVQQAEPGQFETLPDGYDFQTFDPQHPTSAFADFTKAVLRGAASGLNVAYNTLSNDLEGVNFSSIRSGVLEERDQWRALQGWIIEQLHTRIYQEWIKWAILNKSLDLPFEKIDSKYAAVHFQPRGWSWVDPLKDAKASSEQYHLGTTTLTDIAASQGKDLDDIFQQRRRELDMAERYQLDIGKTTDQTMNMTEDEDNG